MTAHALVGRRSPPAADPAGGAAGAGDPLLPRARRRAPRVRDARERAAAGRRLVLAQPPAVRLAEPGLAPLPRAAGRARRPSSATTSAASACPTGTSTTSRSRPGSATSRRSSTRRATSGSRCSGCPGLGRRDGLRGRPPGTRHPAGPVRHGLRRAAELHARGPRRGGDLSRDDPGRLGEGGPGFPARLHDPLHPRRDRGADALVRRPPADVDVARQRGRQPHRAPAGGHRRQLARIDGPDPGPAGDRRPVDDVRERGRGVVADPRRATGPAREPQPHPARRRARVAGVHGRGRGVPRAGPAVVREPGSPSGRSSRSRRASSTSCGWSPTAGRTRRSPRP